MGKKTLSVIAQRHKPNWYLQGDRAQPPVLQPNVYHSHPYLQTGAIRTGRHVPACLLHEGLSGNIKRWYAQVWPRFHFAYQVRIEASPNFPDFSWGKVCG